MVRGPQSAQERIGLKEGGYFVTVSKSQPKTCVKGFCHSVNHEKTRKGRELQNSPVFWFSIGIVFRCISDERMLLIEVVFFELQHPFPFTHQKECFGRLG